MPSPRVTFWLAGLVLLGCGYLFFFERHAQSTSERRARGARVLELRAEEVARLRIRRDVWTSAVVERVSATDFRVVEPVPGAADGAAMARLLSTLEFLDSRADLPGEGADGARRPQPVQQEGGGDLTGVVALVAGERHACALVEWQLGAATELYCWGDNATGQLGDAGGGLASLARRVARPDGSPLEGVAAVAAGSGHGCVLVDHSPEVGEVRCFGEAPSPALGLGALGTGTAESPVPVLRAPERVLEGVRDLGLGAEHACAVADDELLQPVVYCWGTSRWSSLGDGSEESSAYPVLVRRQDGTPLAGAAAVATGFFGHSCALVDDAAGSGQVWCWGDNSDGEVGDYWDGSSLLSPLVHAVPVLLEDGSPLAGASALGLGADSSCAVVAGRVLCWGANNAGQLGNDNGGSTADAPAPLVVQYDDGSDVVGAVAVAAGYDSACALLDLDTQQGQLRCWGRNLKGQLGDGTFVASRTAVSVTLEDGTPLTGATHLAAGDGHVCATAGGALLCWGESNWGQLGNGDMYTDQPYAAPATRAGGAPLTGVVAVGAGLYHTCAVHDGGGQPGQVACFGMNDDGQLGNGSGFRAQARAAPVLLQDGAPLAGVLAMTGGESVTCALAAAAGGATRALCFGAGDLGQLGIGVGYLGDGYAGLPLGPNPVCAAGDYPTCGGAANRYASGSRNDSCTYRVELVP